METLTRDLMGQQSERTSYSRINKCSGFQPVAKTLLASLMAAKAVAAVLRVAPPGSQAALTDCQLTSDQLAALELGPNGVRELGYMP